MELDEFKIAPYKDAIRLMEKWKIVPVKTFHNLIPGKLHKTYSYKYISKLEKIKLIQKVKLPSSNDIIIVPSKELNAHLDLSFNMDQFFHDTVVSYVASGLLGLEAFKDQKITFEHESVKFSSGSIIPDIILDGVSPGSNDEFKLAVEIEISRKSFSKIDEKILSYAQEMAFDLVIYFFTKIEMFDLFKKRIGEISNQPVSDVIKKKICLVLVEDYFSFPEEILKSRCYSNEKDGTLADFF